MDTKPINDTLDQTAIEVKAPTPLDERSHAGPAQPGPVRLRLIEDTVGEVAPETDEAGLAASAAAEQAAEKREGRFQILPHRFAGRTVLKRRRR